ncbi:hypothetical protein M752DRAFT_273238 [Aspergillus phoenicis ATCC 13157]|uniref:Uncharacterized protein n=1 Tax=Aspergillus phoenicis ATCC 13157 TaxID=1353007 RepID=A0A370PVD0_ASPPH|nr:hypothetical protein M752DRAFT_273238 [Aspergillus phoenicis ATCC 13157]
MNNGRCRCVLFCAAFVFRPETPQSHSGSVLPGRFFQTSHSHQWDDSEQTMNGWAGCYSVLDMAFITRAATKVLTFHS